MRLFYSSDTVRQIAYSSFGQFVEALDKAGELKRIAVPIDTDLLIAEWANRGAIWGGSEWVSPDSSDSD